MSVDLSKIKTSNFLEYFKEISDSISNSNKKKSNKKRKIFTSNQKEPEISKFDANLNNAIREKPKITKKSESEEIKLNQIKSKIGNRVKNL